MSDDNLSPYPAARRCTHLRCTVARLARLSIIASGAWSDGLKFGRKRKLSDYQRSEAIKRCDAGETLAAIAKSYGVDLSMISRL